MSANWVPSSLDELDGELEQSKVAGLPDDLAAKAPLASPAFTGTPTAPTATAGTSTTQLATTAFVAAGLALKADAAATTTALALKAPLASPTFTGALAAVSANDTATPFVTFLANNQTVGLEFNYQAMSIVSSNANADMFLSSKGSGSYVWLQHDNVAAGAGLRVGIDDAPNTLWFGNRDVGITADSGHTIAIGQTSNATTIGISVDTTTGNLSVSGSVKFGTSADAAIPNSGIAWSTDTPGSLKARTPAGVLKTIAFEP